MIKWILILLFVASVLYTHFRGKVRHRPLRQASDHSTFMAPINALMTLFGRDKDQPYHDLAKYPELEHLTGNWQDIRAEAVALQDHIKAASSYNDAGFNSFFRRGWKRFYLKWYGDSHPSARELCPRTTELLAGIPNVKAAMFAELPAGSHLTLHRDPFAGSMRYHLGLVTPNDDRCYIDVDGEKYSWRDGEAVMFDETYLHRAENGSEQDRLILFCDIERPMKYRWAQGLNRFFGRTVMAAASSPNDDSDHTGGLNRAFKYLYAVRKKGKALKKRNKALYYAIKWALFALVIIAIIAW